MDAEVLALTFSETVDGASLVINSIVIQSTGSSTALSHSLQSGPDGVWNSYIVNPEPAVVVTVHLGKNDMNQLKIDVGLADSSADTFVSFVASAISDMNQNQVVAIGSDNALVAASYTADSTDPVLEFFDLDLTAETLALTFSETVDSSSIPSISDLHLFLLFR